MSRIAYVNGRYAPHNHAQVSIEDRGFQFADGVYEVIWVANGRLVDEIPHLDRWDRSLVELHIAPAMARASLRQVMAQVVKRNRVRDGILYMQQTRGASPRNAPFPNSIAPTLTMTARNQPLPSDDLVENGGVLGSVPEIRWSRCDVKSVALLANVLSKQSARECGATEAVFVREADRVVTEGGSSNVFMVDPNGTLVTHPATTAILGGITRERVIKLASELGIPVELRPFTLDEALAAREVFVTSTTLAVLPIVRIDESAIGNGHPGSISLQLNQAYRGFCRAPEGHRT